MARLEIDNPYHIQLLYKGLVSLIDSNSGEGFHNGDQGHMFYVLAAQGKRLSKGTDVEDADTNELFLLIKTLSRLNRELGATEFTWFREELETWGGFCKFAVESYRRNMEKENER